MFSLGRQAVGRNNQPAKAISIVRKPHVVIRTKIVLFGYDSGSDSHEFPGSSFRRRPESRGVGRGECSAGACPPLGRRRGVAESAVPIRRTKPQLQLFIPWCADANRHERLL